MPEDWIINEKGKGYAHETNNDTSCGGSPDGTCRPCAVCDLQPRLAQAEPDYRDGTGTGAFTPEIYYTLLHNKYKKTAAAKNKLSFRTLAGVNLYNQTDEAEAIDSALVKRAAVEALNVADRQVDLAWLAEGDKVNGQMERFRRNIDRILLCGGTPDERERWEEYYQVYQCAINATKDAYMPNAQRKKEYLRISEDVARQNGTLVLYLARKQNATVTEGLLNAEEAQPIDKGSILRDAVERWNESWFAVRGSQTGGGSGGSDGEETVNRN